MILNMRKDSKVLGSYQKKPLKIYLDDEDYFDFL